MPVNAKIAAAFEPAYYTAIHADLAGMTPDQAAAHYEKHGRMEGRTASPFAVRETFLELPKQADTALEIGPFCNPVLTGDNVRYLDVLTADELRERALEIGADPAGCPATIDFIGGLGSISDRFDAVVSSHAIEHQPDLIAHLNDVAGVLHPGGRYYLIIPDKRFCFDHFIAESTIAEVVAAHDAEHDTHSLKSVIEHMALTTHNDPLRHWQGDHGRPLHPDDAMRVEAAIKRHRDSEGGYIDVHAWYFTPVIFAAIVEMLFRLHLTPMRALQVYDTPFGRNEFCAILEVG